MTFGVVSGVGRGVGVLDWAGDCPREGAILGVNLRRPIVTNGDPVVQLFSAVRGGDDALPKSLLDFLLKLSLCQKLSANEFTLFILYRARSSCVVMM